LHNGLLEYFQLMYGDDEGKRQYIITNKKTSKFDHSSEEQRRKGNINGNLRRGIKGSSCRSVQYWIDRGLSSVDATNRVREIQSTNTVENYIKKYGETEGPIKFETRKAEWTEIMSDEGIGKRRSLGLWRYIERYGEVEGTLKYTEMRRKRNTSFNAMASKESLVAFRPILDYCDVHNLKYYLGVDGNNEWHIRDGTHTYFYDLTIPDLSIIVEYNGIAFHPSKHLNTEQLLEWKQLFSHKSAGDVIELDNIKKEVATKNGWHLFYIYADDIIHDLNIIRDYIKF